MALAMPTAASLSSYGASAADASSVGNSFGGLLASLASIASGTRLYDVEIEGASGLAVEGFVSTAALSTLSEMRLLVLSTDAGLDLDALQWQSVRLLLTQSDGSRITRSGFVREAQAMESDGGLARYALTVVPWLWLLTQQTHSRIFQNKSVLEIVGEVFDGYAGAAQWQLAEGVQDFIDALPRRRVCSQYRETDYAFVSRLLAEEGLGFYFTESGDTADDGKAAAAGLTIFCDSAGFAEDASSQSGLGGAGIRFHRASSQQDQDAVQSLASVRQLPSAGLTTAAWDPDGKRIVAANLATHRRYASDRASTPMPVLERYQWAGHGSRVTPAEIARSAQLAQEAQEARHKAYVGSASVRSFQPGWHFVLTDSPFDQDRLFRSAGTASDDKVEGDDRTRFALTRVVSAGFNNLPVDLKKAVDTLLGLSTQDALIEGLIDDIDTLDPDVTLGELLDDARQHGYACRFTALRSVIPWRPESAGRRHPAKAEGPQSAVVVSAGDGNPELHRDAQGRIQVRFHWQRGPDNGMGVQDQSSGWVRIANRYAGNGIGSSFVPRVGQEVLVGFVDQDIDQPIVLGALYNGRGEGGDSPTPAGASAESPNTAVFAQAQDRIPSAQGNTRGGNAPAWHGASADADGHRNAAGLSGLKSNEFGSNGSGGYNQLQHDDHDGELRSQLASTQSASQLNLGHLIHTADNHRGSQRGSGFELRTDQSAAIRGGAGVLLTTWRNSTPGGAPEPIGDVTAPLALLNQAKGLSEAFDDAAKTHMTVGLSTRRGTTKAEASVLTATAAPLSAMVKAGSATVDADDDGKAVSDAPNSLSGNATAPASRPTDTGASPPVPHLGAPMVIGAGQAGIGMVAGQAIQIATQESNLLATGGDLNLSSGNQLTIHSGQAIGLLSGAAKAGDNNAGLTAIAAKGPVTIQAQADTMNLDSQKALTMVSANASAEFAAATSIRLATSQGASIEIEEGNITVQCPGTLTVHAGQQQFAQGTQLSREMNSWPETKFDDVYVIRNRATGEPMANALVEVTRSDGAKLRLTTDQDGRLPKQQSLGLDQVIITHLGKA